MYIESRDERNAADAGMKSIEEGVRRKWRGGGVK